MSIVVNFATLLTSLVMNVDVTAISEAMTPVTVVSAPHNGRTGHAPVKTEIRIYD